MNVLVTGASQGIGAATALAFASAGHNIGVNFYEDQGVAESVRDSCRNSGVEAECFFADVSNKDNCRDMLDRFVGRFGKIDVLVNNAGGALKIPDGGFAEMPLDYWDSQIRLNLGAAAYCSQPAIKNMIANKTRGKIINISSIHGQVTWVKRKMLPYSAAKGGLNMFTKVLAVEMAKCGINVNAIAPGFIQTSLSVRYTPEQKRAFCRKIPLGFLGQVDDITPLIVFLADDAKSRFITGQVFCVDGGQSIDGAIDSMLEETKA